MNHQKSELYFLLVLLAGIFVLAFLIFKPFIYALVLAMVFATVFAPVHRRALVWCGGKNSLAALISTIIVLVVVIVPVTFVGAQIFTEASQLYTSLVNNGGASGLTRSISNTIEGLTGFSPVPIEFTSDINQYTQQGLSWLLEHLGLLFANIARAVISIFVFLVALYYIFKDGSKLKKAVVSLSPLQDIHDETIFSKLSLAVNSIIKGSLFVALVQGVLTAVGFTIFGIPNPTLWGSVATIGALIPGIGTTVVLLPAVLYLFFNAQTVLAVGLLIWGMVAVGLVDNFLGPKLVGKGTHMHSFLILLSILGGIGFFGPIGFVLGPLSLSLLFAFLEIYVTIDKEHQNSAHPM